VIVATTKQTLMDNIAWTHRAGECLQNSRVCCKNTTPFSADSGWQSVIPMLLYTH
jgi:hypothetical protein